MIDIETHLAAIETAIRQSELRLLEARQQLRQAAREFARDAVLYEQSRQLLNRKATDISRLGLIGSQ
jgi:hypothetical protein